MGMLTIRHLPDEVYLALLARAAENGRSTAAEVRAILADALKPKERILMGDAMSAYARAAGLTNDDIDAITNTRDRTPAEPMSFE